MEEIENFQGNCLYKTNVNYSLSQEEKDYISNLEYRSKDNIFFISKNISILDNPLFNNLVKIFDKYSTYYIKNILEIDHKLRRLNSWVTINKKNSFHPPHHHPNTFISVCFYPQIKNGGITFETYQDPIRNKTNFKLEVLNDNQFNSRNFSFNLSSKDLVIFPGWVVHYGHPNLDDSDRIMIGANYFISGNIGNPEGVNCLYLG